MRLPLRLAALALALSTLASVLGASGTSHEPGHWENLGEDGVIFVPATPPATAAYLPAPPLGDYHNASEAVAALHALAAARPDLLRVEQVGSSVQGRPLVVATLTAPGDASGRTRVLFDGAHHGDEVIASEILVRFVQRAIAQYDTNASMQAALAQVVVDVVPMVNPDGVDFVPQCSHYAQCRKNARGVDLNRNYPFHWGGTGSSGDPSSATYRGPSPASEPETQAVKTLLDTRDYAVYASLHSGAEMILWPWGWTTTPPPEATMYQQLGNELTAITGAPHGQVSRILYAVSGDSMDQAYGSAAGWRALAISPETYQGSGTAFDWWFLFNPAETNAAISPVAARWDAFLWHLVKQAPLYAPARIEAPASVSLGPDAGDISFVVTGAPRRPLAGASLRLDAGDAATVLSANPVPLGASGGAGAFSVLPSRGGEFPATLRLDAGVAGTRTHALTLQLQQVGMTLALEKSVLESPDTAHATVIVDAGPFASVAGTVAFTSLPDGAALGTATFEATPGAPATLALSFPVAALRGGQNVLRASATFTALDAEGAPREGQLHAERGFLVLRPQLDLEKRLAPSSAAGSPVSVLAVYRNTGTFPAQGVVVRETIPPGYAYWTRDGPVPVPLDPVSRPAPTAVEADGDGVDLVFDLGTIPAGGFKVVQYRMLGLVPGEHALPSAWSYEGHFSAGTVAYRDGAAAPHRVTPP